MTIATLPDDPLLSERIQAALAGVEQVEMELRRKVDETTGGGTVRSPGGEKVPEGYGAAVAEYYRVTRAAFPDQRNENAVIHHSDDAVIVEFDLLGTHRGELLGIPATNKKLTVSGITIHQIADGKILESTVARGCVHPAGWDRTSAET